MVGKVGKFVCVATFLSVVIYLLLPSSNPAEEVVGEYSEMNSNDEVALSKAQFYNYGKSVLETSIEEETKAGQGGQSGSTLAQRLYSAAISEYEWYSSTGQRGPSKYYYWFDLIPDMLSASAGIEEYEPVGSKTVPSSGFYSQSLRGSYQPWCAIFASCMLQKVGALDSGEVTRQASCQLMLDGFLSNGAEIHVLKGGYLYNGRWSSFLSNLSSAAKAAAADVVVEDELHPSQGDIMFFNYASNVDCKVHHVAIVSEVTEDRRIVTINGNQGNGGSSATEVGLWALPADDPMFAMYVVIKE